MPYRSGRHFLQIPGPTNVPERVLRALARPTIDHRGSEFAKMVKALLEDLKQIFKTSRPIVIYPGSATGGWEAALVNTLSPEDRVLMFETGHFAGRWRDVAEGVGLRVEFVPGDWRHGVDPPSLKRRLLEDPKGEIKAVAVVHNETSTGVLSPVADIRRAMDEADHPALLLVDAVSSLGTCDYHHDDWGVDVTVAGSQKGLMMPPGLAFNALSSKAVEAARKARLPRSYWDWEAHLKANAAGLFPYTPATNLLFGLSEALRMLLEEGLDSVFERHIRLARATRRAVRGWGLEIQCADPKGYSTSLTAVRLPEGHDADALRRLILERFNMSLGKGLGKLGGRVLRIGHLGDFNELMLMGTLSGVEMGLELAGVPFNKRGVLEAMEALTSS